MKRQNVSKKAVFELLVVVLTISIYLNGSLAGLAKTGFQVATETEAAAEETTAATAVENSDVSTVIIVSSDNPIDLAIAMGISSETNYPIMIMGDEPTIGQLDAFTDGGEYQEVSEVVFIGGPESMSTETVDQFRQVSDYLEETDGFGYEVTTIAGATGTETAVEAMNYLAPGTETIHLVSYGGDADFSAEDFETLALSAQLGVVIPVDSGESEGLPAVVAEGIYDHPVDATVNLVGDAAEDPALEEDLAELEDMGEIFHGTEVTGEPEEVISTLEDEVARTLESGTDVIFAEIGESLPAPQPGQIIFYYEDENNDGIDDDHDTDGDGISDITGVPLNDLFGLQGITAPDFIIDRIDGGYVGDITFTGDDQGTLEQIENEVEDEFPREDITTSDDAIEVTFDHAIENAAEIEDLANAREEEIKVIYREHIEEFEEKVSDDLEQLRAFYELKADELSEEIRNDIIDALEEAGEGGDEDPVAAFKLMHEIDSKLFVDDYAENNYHDDPEARAELEAGANNDLDAAVAELGVENPGDVAVAEKIGVFEAVNDFVLPSEAGEVAREVTAIISTAPPAELGETIFESIWERPAHEEFAERIATEYQASGKKEDPTKWDPAKLEQEYRARISLEAEATVSGIFASEDYSDPAERAKFFDEFRSAYTVLESKGIKPYALPPEALKEAYTKYADEGKLSDEVVQKMEAYYVATRAFEGNNLGDHDDPIGYTWDGRAVSFYDPATEAYVQGDYIQGKETFVYNHNGMLVAEDKSGTSYTYNPNDRISGYFSDWTYDSTKGTWSSPDGSEYTPPAYRDDSGGFKYQYYDTSAGQYYENTYVGAVYEYDYKNDGFSYYTAQDTGSAVYTGTFAYDPTKGYQQVTTSIPVGAEYKPGTGQYEYKAPDGSTYNYDPQSSMYYNSDGTLAGGTGSGYTGGTYTGSGTYTPPGYSYDQYYSGSTSGTSGGEYYSSPTYTYTGATSTSYSGSSPEAYSYTYTDPATGQTTTSTYYAPSGDSGSGGSYSGGTTGGTYTGGDSGSYSGGGSGGYSAPSGGGDGGGGGGGGTGGY